jgi:protein gp37
MAENSKIEWTDATWNPVAGCSKVSQGCKNCYPISHAHRMSSNPNSKISAKYAGTVTPDGKNWTGKVNFDEEALKIPLGWKKPRRIFVNSMSD